MKVQQIQHEIAAVLFRDDVERFLAYVFKEMTQNKEGYTSPNSDILSMTKIDQDVLKDVDIPAPVTTFFPVGTSFPEIEKPTTLTARMRIDSASEGSARSEGSQNEKEHTPVRIRGETIPPF